MGDVGDGGLCEGGFGGCFGFLEERFALGIAGCRGDICDDEEEGTIVGAELEDLGRDARVVEVLLGVGERRHGCWWASLDER